MVLPPPLVATPATIPAHMPVFLCLLTRLCAGKHAAIGVWGWWGVFWFMHALCFFCPNFYRKLPETIMTVHSSNQLTLDFLPGLTELHTSALACVDAQIKSSGKPLKTIAADMDMSSSELSRKLANNASDPRHFTLDDFEKYLTMGDTTPLLYLVQKYCVDSEFKQRQALATLAAKLPDFIALLKAAGVQA